MTGIVQYPNSIFCYSYFLHITCVTSINIKLYVNDILLLVHITGSSFSVHIPVVKLIV